jgi:hypothetical protein
VACDSLVSYLPFTRHIWHILGISINLSVLITVLSFPLALAWWLVASLIAESRNDDAIPAVKWSPPIVMP